MRRTTALRSSAPPCPASPGFGRVFALAYAIGFNAAAPTRTTSPTSRRTSSMNSCWAASCRPRSSRSSSSASRPTTTRGTRFRPSSPFSLALARWARRRRSRWPPPSLVHLYTVFNTSRLGRRRARGRHLVAPHVRAPVAFYGAITITTALLLARRRFANPKFSPIANNLVVIGVLLAIPARGRRSEPRRPSATTRPRSSCSAWAPRPASRCRRSSKRPASATSAWVWDPRHPAVRTVVRAVVLDVRRGARQPDRALRRAGAGQPAAPARSSVYLAAYMFFLLPHGVIAVSVMDSLLPELAARWTHGELDGVPPAA